MKTRSIISRIAVVLALVTSAVTANAQPRSNPAADSLYDEGKKLYQAAELAQGPAASFEPACAKFEASLKLDSEFVDARGYLALCYEHAGRLATAWSEFRNVRKQALVKNLEDAVAIADTHIKSLEPRLARIRIRLAPAQPSGLTVKQDGLVVPSETFDSLLAIDRGDHTFLAEAPGFTTSSQQISIVDGDSKEVVIPTLASASHTPSAAHDSPTTPNSSELPARMSTRRKAAIATSGAGLIAVGVGLGFGFKARSQYNDGHANGHCDSQNSCDPIGFALIDSAFSTARISTIITGIGIAAIGTGAYLWLTGAPTQPHEESSRTSLAPTIRPGLVGVAMQGRF